VKKIIGEKFHGVAREKIPWYPKIDYEKCIGCGKCVDYCKLGVYVFEEKHGKKVSVIRHPYSCVVFCSGCDPICPVAAISHPSKKEAGKIISTLRKAQKEKQ
jgi:NAD-dependent dihydropyrimidine dehydrogenase PreA subunit